MSLCVHKTLCQSSLPRNTRTWANHLKPVENIYLHNAWDGLERNWCDHDRSIVDGKMLLSTRRGGKSGIRIPNWRGNQTIRSCWIMRMMKMPFLGECQWYRRRSDKAGTGLELNMYSINTAGTKRVWRLGGQLARQ